MMTLHDALAEVDQEAPATGRLLERLPASRLTWRPHPKSMTLGQLALHVATIPHRVAESVAVGHVDAATLVAHPECEAIEVIRAAWAETLGFVRDARQSAAAPDGSWSVMRGSAAILTVPADAARRVFMLNHWYHHRGQLTVYLRLLDVPLPVVYGNSADEDPLA